MTGPLQGTSAVNTSPLRRSDRALAGIELAPAHLSEADDIVAQTYNVDGGNGMS